MVAIASGKTSCLSIGSTSSFLKAKPRIAVDSTRPIAMAAQKGRWKFIAASMKKAGSMTNSPWAKLIV